MYVGRIIGAGINATGSPTALYRISSRSFKDRMITISGSHAEVVNRNEAEVAESPFIYYGCFRVVGNYAVVGNGTHTDWIANKISWGASPRDALADTLRFMDFEHDSLSTPRIASVICPEQGKVYFGSVSRTDLLTWQLPLISGQVHCIATYESMHRPESVLSGPLSGISTAELANEVYNGGIFAQFDSPVCGFAATFHKGGWSKGATHFEN